MKLFNNIFHRSTATNNPDMIQLLRERAKIIKKLNCSGYSVCLEELESLRKRALSCEHLFEESVLLLDEIRLIVNGRENTNLYQKAIMRLREIEDILDDSHQDFSTKIEDIYFNGKSTIGRILVMGYFKAFYDDFYNHCEYMASCLQHHAAIICAKIMSKIFSISRGFPIYEQIENEFKMAVDYGYISEVDNAILHYDKALHMAKECNDDLYLYIAICRKLSVCQSVANIDIRTNVDRYLRDAIKEMISLCEIHGKNPNELGNYFLSLEKSMYDSCNSKEKKMRETRIARLKEALPVMNLILALERGDAQTAEIYEEVLSESEKNVYGGSSGSGANIVSSLYNEHYSSPERDEAMSCGENYGTEETEDGNLLGVTIELFPADMPKAYILVSLQMMIRNEVMSGHPINTDHLYNIAKELTGRLCSANYGAAIDYHRGKSHHTKEDSNAAEHFYLKALELLHTSDPSAMVGNMIVSLSISLGSLYTECKTDEAIRIMESSMDSLNINDVQYSRLKVSLHTNLARAYAKLGEGEMFESHFMKAMNELISEATRRMPYLSRVNKEAYWQEVQKSVWELLTMIDSNSSPYILTKAYESVLYAKGFLLSSEVALKKAIENDITLKHICNLYEETAEYEAHKRLWGISTNDSADEYMAYFINSTKISIATENVMKEHFCSLQISFSDIVSGLMENEVVIDYYDYPIGGDKQYIAFVFRKGDCSPRMLKICKESEIQAEFKITTDNAGSVYEYNGTPASNLGMMLFGRIADSCEILPNETIYFIPSGAIHKICIEALTICIETEERIYERYHRFIRLSHARNLISIKDGFELKDIQLYGGLDYDWDQDEESGDLRGYNHNNDEITVTPLLPWHYLPSSKIEVIDIADIWNANKNIPAKVNTGKDGSAEHFYSLDGNAPSVIHLATHGFFETIRSAKRLPILRDSHQPMDLAGIVMSYGNDGWILGTPEHHKGIIRASDISSMDLTQTKMAILSACHSAEGTIHSDGVFGLQRAFKKAGVGCIIMSLWEVSDEAGAFFMKVFYDDLLNGSKNRHNSITVARQKTKEKYPNPMYWAGFILID